MKFLLDANIPRSSLDVFNSLGHEVMHVSDVHLATATDQEIVSYATRTKSVVVTRDMDFGTLTVYHKMPARSGR